MLLKYLGMEWATKIYLEFIDLRDKSQTPRHGLWLPHHGLLLPSPPLFPHPLCHRSVSPFPIWFTVGRGCGDCWELVNRLSELSLSWTISLTALPHPCYHHAQNIFLAHHLKYFMAGLHLSPAHLSPLVVSTLGQGWWFIGLWISGLPELANKNRGWLINIFMYILIYIISMSQGAYLFGTHLHHKIMCCLCEIHI